MSLKKQATSSLVWTFSQQFGNQLIGFVISLILARLLLPEEFGLIGMISIFVSVGNTLLNAGLTQSLIRSKDLDQDDYSTVFYFNLVTSVLIYGVIYFSAPFIADFYQNEILIYIVRLYCITFIISAFSAVQLARLTKKMDFKTQTMITIPSTIVGGILGVSMAFMGYGVWSLVWSAILSSLINAVQLWIYSKWVPSLVFNMQKFRIHFGFGYKLTIASILNTIFNNIYIIVIGKFYSVSQVGFYTRAETMKQLPVTNISNALNKVTYPLFSSIQDDDIRLKRVYKQLMQMVVFVIAPILIFLAILAEPTFRFLFTEKWLPAVPYFQILCVTGILHPIHAYNLNVLKVKGRTDLFLKLEIYKKVIIVLVLGATFQFGIYALLFGQVFINILAFIINTHYSGKFLKYNALSQILDILPIFAISLTSGLIIWGVDKYLVSYDQIDILRILIGSLIGSLIYLGQAYFFKINSLSQLWAMVSKKINS